MNRFDFTSATDTERRGLITALAVGSGLLLCPRLQAWTLLGEGGSDKSPDAFFDTDTLELFTNRLTAPQVATKQSNPQPDRPAFFYYGKDKRFTLVKNAKPSHQSDLIALLPKTSATVKLVVKILRPNHEHLDYITKYKNGTLAVSIASTFAHDAPTRPQAGMDNRANTGATGYDTPGDHFIASVSPPPFDYQVPFPSGSSLATDGASLSSGAGAWYWQLFLQEKPPRWKVLLEELLATSGQSPVNSSQTNTTQSGGEKSKNGATIGEVLAKALGTFKGPWGIISALNIPSSLFNLILGRFLQNEAGNSHTLLSLPNTQIFTSKAGSQTDFNGIPLPSGDYVAVPSQQSQIFQDNKDKYELSDEGIIVPAGSIDTQSALKEALLPPNGQSGPGLTYVSFSVSSS